MYHKDNQSVLLVKNTQLPSHLLEKISFSLSSVSNSNSIIMNLEEINSSWFPVLCNFLVI